MKKYFLIIVYFLTANLSLAEQNYGIELDALPWLTGGYYVSGWYAADKLRYRAVLTEINVPDSFVEDGYKDKQIRAYAVIMDYFPSVSRKGVWYGAGLEYWQTSIANESDNAQAEYDNTVFTVGLGYVWQITESVYLNPWAALHLIVGGEQDITVGNRRYHQGSLTPSASIKLGWQF